MDRIERVARETFGWTELRPGQREAIEAVLSGRDTLAVLATGAGKSAIYQVAALLVDGPTVVVSPLLALQRDQVNALDEATDEGAAHVNAAVGARERDRALRDLRRDRLEFLFLAPEQLANEEVLAQLRRAEPSLMVVDEAHCVSEWGHDFRPDYLRLGEVAEALGRPTVLALTATAAPPVRDEIVERLGMRDPAVVVRGFDRPNLWLGVERFRDAQRKHARLLEWVREAEPGGIVYTATRRDADRIAADLAEQGQRACAYHAGMGKKARIAVEREFMEDRADVVVATVAFGMGIDKPNVRWVLHASVSESVDSYWQEAGRAGRDGDAARALLLYRPEDLGLRRFFVSGTIGADHLRAVDDLLRGPAAKADADALAARLKLSPRRVRAILGRLDDAGGVEAAVEREQRRRDFDRTRVEMIRAYAEHGSCRREFSVSYFGEPFQGPCGNCDNCEAGRYAESEEVDTYPAGSRVRHDRWGEGTVQRTEDSRLVVLFDEGGYRMLELELVEAGGLLEAVA
ncbi:MAG TPA: RecQ family ATP-dependent DNA helicase [Thermoleophilaceae bacterium]|nr:RecQ family ATP-dependent DNA helicase [Thermoleophilaceae bacterium]